MIAANLSHIRATLPEGVVLVCVSKYHSSEAIAEAYQAGERDFAESRVQEFLVKQANLPKDIRWHFIGHLQTNKVRAVIPFVHLIQSVDSVRLLDTLQKECARIGRSVNVLLEVHVATESSKSGFLPEEVLSLFQQDLHVRYPNLCFRGIMGMATHTDDPTEIQRCFTQLRDIFLAERQHLLGRGKATYWDTLSMGMTDDYPLAIPCGATMVRVGSGIFGTRT